MQKTLLRHSLLTVVAIFALAVAAPVATLAQPARAHEAQTQAQERREAGQQTVQTQQEAQTQSTERREQGQARLEAAKLKVCQNREKAIQNIMARISDRGNKQLDVFTKISDRVQAFYTEQGNTLSNYDALVAEVNAKKEAARTAVDVVHDGSHEFKCDGKNPKAVADSFKEDLKAMNAALKEYKTAVKNLIVGVKSAQSTTTEGGTEGSQG